MEGIKHDIGKLRWDLIPIEPIEDAVEVMSLGALKYGDNNWKELDNFNDRYFAAMMRHIVAWRLGNIFNYKDWGKRHLAHALVNLIFLNWKEIEELKKLKDEDFK